LLANSIDAGAERITVRIDRGGKAVLKVTDNGVGMSRDDLLLCLERHATSKIHSESDLLSIESLGFRGEALPSISSVSRMTITTRPPDQLAGYRLRVAGGKLKSIDETGTPPGTIVDVRDLFFNMPVRRKFLRSVRTETDHIIDTFSRIALPFTHIHFKLDDAAGKTILNLSVSENELNRISALMGRNVAAAMINGNHEAEGLRVRTYSAPPDLTRTRGDRIFIYVNGRNVRDRLLSRATIEAYGQRLMKGRYPYTVVFVEIDPSLVDINVHPTKQEIRFRNSHQAYQTVLSAIERSLGQRLHAISDTEYMRAEDTTNNKVTGEITRMAMAEPEPLYSESPQRETAKDKEVFKEELLIKEGPRIIGQLKGAYILCQTREGLLLVDQHAAHERIVYETLRKCYGSQQIESQRFLIPPKLELSFRDGRVVLRRLDQLVELGLELEHFGGSTFLLRSVPSILVDVQWENFFCDFLSVLEEEGDLTTAKALDRLFTVMACHGAIRAGKRMSQEEMALLFSQLGEMDLPTHCPHGRPVSVNFSYYEIEKMFKRVV
jgi:DNA mismatch repair protein MutL